jgi:HEAT repeat protein
MRQWMLPACVCLGLLLGAPNFGRAQETRETAKRDLDSALKFLNSSDPKDRSFALVTMDYLGAKALSASPLVVKALFDSNPEVRGYAAQAIGKVDPTIAGPVVTLATGKDYQAQLTALQTLTKLGVDGAGAVPALVKFLETDKAKPEDRAALVTALGSVGAKDPTAAKALAALALNNDQDPALRKAAIQSLGKMESGASALPQFMTALNGGNAGAQQLALAALAIVGKGNPEVVQAVKKAAENDPNPKVKEAAQKAVAELNKPKKP